MILSPVHQFEIRFTTLLNFSNVVRPIVAPFAKLATRTIVDNENLISEKISLIFDDEFYQILILSDRIIFRSDRYDVNNLLQNNSFIEEPFFNIFNKIFELQDFGKITNVLFWSFYINTQPSKQFENVREEFKVKNFNADGYISFIPRLTDMAITLESKDEHGSQLSITTGPYIGIEDLTKRGLKVNDKALLVELANVGEIIEYKYFMITSKVNFSIYKELTKKAEAIIQQKWGNR